MGTPPLNKNGHDQAQDRELREIKASNNRAHLEIGKSVDGVRKLLWGLLLAGIAGLVGVLSYITASVTSIRKDVQELDDKVDDVEILAREHESEGLQIGRGLRRDVNKNEQEIKDLRDKRQGKD